MKPASQAAGAGSVVSRAAGEDSKRGPKYEFKFNTADGRVYECYVDKATELRAWLETMPHWEAGLTMGYLYKRKHGSKKTTFDRRFAIFDPGMLPRTLGRDIVRIAGELAGGDELVPTRLSQDGHRDIAASVRGPIGGAEQGVFDHAACHLEVFPELVEVDVPV